MTNFFKKWR